MKNESIIDLGKEMDKSITTQYLVEIKKKLFSSENGDVDKYLIYVREGTRFHVIFYLKEESFLNIFIVQDLDNTDEQPKLSRHFFRTIKEMPIDYLALNISGKT